MKKLLGFACAHKVLIALVSVPLLLGAAATAVHEIGYSPRMDQCIEIGCLPGGDGGVLQQQTSTVYTDAGQALVYTDAGGLGDDAGGYTYRDAGLAVQYTDAGLLTQIIKALIPGARYELTVTSESAVRLRNGAAPGAFSSGTGQIENEGTDKVFIPRSAPDGGLPQYNCVSNTAATRVQLCPLE